MKYYALINYDTIHKVYSGEDKKQQESDLDELVMSSYEGGGKEGYMLAAEEAWIEEITKKEYLKHKGEN